MGDKALEALSPLAADLRRHSPDRYLATLFAPAARRESLIALYAFDHELAHIQHAVTEPMAGLIRLQWWDDVIDGMGQGGTIAHPVVKALDRAVVRDGLDRSFLKHAIDGRRRPFEEDLPPDPDGFEAYLDAIGGSITAAAAALLGSTTEAARKAGAVCAAASLIGQEHGSHAAGERWMPSHWPLNGRPADWALPRLAEARSEAPKPGRSMLAAFFPATLAGIRLRRRGAADPRHAMPTAPAHLLWHWLRGRF